MLPTWHQDLESLENIKLGPFLFELAADDELDDLTKGSLVEIAQDPNFLFAVEDYLQRTEIFH